MGLENFVLEKVNFILFFVHTSKLCHSKTMRFCDCCKMTYWQNMFLIFVETRAKLVTEEFLQEFLTRT